MVVRKQHQFGNHEGVVEPDRQHQADAQPAHGVDHEVEAELHGCCRRHGPVLANTGGNTPLGDGM